MGVHVGAAGTAVPAAVAAPLTSRRNPGKAGFWVREPPKKKLFGGEFHPHPVGSHDPENVLEIFFFSSHGEVLKEPPGKQSLDLTSTPKKYLRKLKAKLKQGC